jgi:hypothetical protein
MLTLVVYVPGAGGNHLKNLLCLSNSYANCNDLDPAVYERPDPERPPGEVWCVGGRNLQEIFFERMVEHNDQNWILAAHVGEMFQYQQQLAAITNKKIVVISLEHEPSRRQLDHRQIRLGQCIHPYWLDEELIHIYQAHTLSRLFGTTGDKYFTLPIQDFWHKNFAKSLAFSQLESFLNIKTDSDLVDQYHRLWHAANGFN